MLTGGDHALRSTATIGTQGQGAMHDELLLVVADRRQTLPEPSELKDNVEESCTTRVTGSCCTRPSVSRTCGARIASAVTWELPSLKRPWLGP